MSSEGQAVDPAETLMHQKKADSSVALKSMQDRDRATTTADIVPLHVLDAGDTDPSIDSNGTPINNKDDEEAREFSKGRSWRFWAIIPSLMFTTLLSAVEVTGTYFQTPFDIYIVLSSETKKRF